MAVSNDRAFAINRLDFNSSNLWIPCMGGLWVVANMVLLGLAVFVAYPSICSVTAGLLNGTILSVVAVAKASDRLQAGTTGLLGGVSLSGLRNDGSMLWKATQGVHGLVDQAFIVLGIQTNEQTHGLIANHVLYMSWTMLFVVMASLLAEWVRKSRLEELPTVPKP